MAARLCQPVKPRLVNHPTGDLELMHRLPMADPIMVRFGHAFSNVTDSSKRRVDRQDHRK